MSLSVVIPAYIKIIRPLNCLFVLAVVFAAGSAGSLPQNWLVVFFAAVVAVVISAAGYVINDFYDIKIDSFNKPNRVLPQKKISPQNAYLYSIFLFVTGISLSFFTAKIELIILAVFNSLLLFYYAKRFKYKLITGNIIVSYLASSVFVYGGLAGGKLDKVLILAFYTFFYTLIREIVKDIEDMEGDRKAYSMSVPLAFGIEKTLLIIRILSLFLLLSLLISFLTQLISLLFFLIVSIFWVIPMFFFVRKMSSNPTTKVFSQISKLMKLHMFFILLILLFLNYF